MRFSAIFMLAAALGSIALLAARAGGAPVPIARVASASSRPISVLQGRHRGASPYAVCTEARTRRARFAQAVPMATTLPSYLYVVDNCGPVIDVLHDGTNYREDGYFSNGLIFPDDAFVDSHGDLFVANASVSAGAILEYAPGNWNAPSFTYNANIAEPAAVTTDAQGNVYEGDYSGTINEYYPNRNVSIASCQPLNNGDPISIYGVAVDSRNNVFATVFDLKTFYGELVEYPGGLNSCGGLTVLLTEPYFLDGIAVDKNANLLVTFENGDVGSSGVASVQPPYNTFDEFIGPPVFGDGGVCNVRLNKTNKLAFVTDNMADTVTVLNYPSGTVVTVLGTANGLSQPLAAVEAPNAVY
jgi:hypothetical protein